MKFSENIIFTDNNETKMMDLKTRFGKRNKRKMDDIFKRNK